MHATVKGGERMARGKNKPIEQYEHLDKRRKNNPPAGLVTPETDRDDEKKTYTYDPHLDPQLIWAGKVERTSFKVPTVSLHVHERIDPHTIIEAVERRNLQKVAGISVSESTLSRTVRSMGFGRKKGRSGCE